MQTCRRILVVGDRSLDEDARLQAGPDGEVEFVASLEEARELLATGSYSSVLVSPLAVTSDGAEVVIAAKASEQLPASQFSAADVLQSLLDGRQPLSQEEEDAAERHLPDWHLLQAIIDNIPAWIYVKDREGRLVLVNRALCRILAPDGSSPIGKTSYDFFPPELADAHTHNDMMVMDTGLPHEAEEIISEEYGSTVFLTQKFPLRDSEGRIWGVGGVSTDITARKQAEASVQAAARSFEVLASAASELLLSDKPQSVVQSLAEKVMAALDCHAFFNFLVDADRGQLHLNAYAGIPEEEARRIEWLDYGVAVCGCVAQSGCRIIAENIPETPDPRTDLVESYGIRAYACHPLLGHDGKPIGTLSFGTKSRDTFAEDEIALMKTVADHVAIAMERIRLYEVTQQRAAELESVFANASEGISFVDPDGRTVWMNDAGKRITGREDWEGVTPFSGVEIYELDGQRIDPSEGPVARALRGHTVTNHVCRVAISGGRTFNLGTTASPVFGSSGEIAGAVAVFRDITEQVEFQQKQDALLKREQRITDILQHAIIPEREYDFPGFDIAVRYQAALEESWVGGDFYDVFDLGDNKIGILIGDVAGKGLAAALQVASVRHTVRSYAYLDPRPGRVLTLTNDALSRDTRPVGGGTAEMKMLTAFFAVIDLSVGLLTYANGGHEPAMLRRPNGDVEELTTSGRALGIMPGFEYAASRTILQPGDTVALYTDGIAEARQSPTNLFGIPRIKAHLGVKRRRTAAEVADGLVRRAKRHGGGVFKDDAAVVVFRFGKERR